METNNTIQTVSGGDALPTATETTPEYIGTVSGNDASESALSSDLLFYAEMQTGYLEEINEHLEEQKQTIWEKPIEEYTPTEGLLLIIMALLLGVVIFKFVGGIICNR